MDTSKFGRTFAPYTPPPDEPAAPHDSPSARPSAFKRPWFPVQGLASSSSSAPSYQSGGVPTFGNSLSGGFGAEEEVLEAQQQSGAQMWETRFGWRVDVCAAATYLAGPISALFFLIFETSNDFVRFHAYQSALLTTPLVLLRILASFIFPSWLQIILTLTLVVVQASMATRAFRDGSRDLTRYEFPYIGGIAERWLGEE